MSIADVFAEAEAEHRDKVLAATWGHLAPGPEKYRGHITFTCASFGGDIVIIEAAFKGLDDSPWLYDDMYKYVCKRAPKRQGKALRFDGTYQKFKNGGCRFSGKIRVLK